MFMKNRQDVFHVVTLLQDCCDFRTERADETWRRYLFRYRSVGVSSFSHFPQLSLRLLQYIPRNDDSLSRSFPHSYLSLIGTYTCPVTGSYKASQSESRALSHEDVDASRRVWDISAAQRRKNVGDKVGRRIYNRRAIDIRRSQSNSATSSSRALTSPPCSGAIAPETPTPRPRWNR